MFLETFDESGTNANDMRIDDAMKRILNCVKKDMMILYVNARLFGGKVYPLFIEEPQL